MLDDAIHCQFAQRTCMHGPAIAKNGDPVSDRAQFLQPMRDVDHAHVPLPERAHDAKHFSRFRSRKRRRGLIEDHQARTMQDSAANFDQLFPGGRELLNAPVRLQWKLMFSYEPAGGFNHAMAPDKSKR